ncbi:hypothetical protein ACN47E_008184 [Coniothyrium glycines]
MGSIDSPAKVFSDPWLKDRNRDFSQPLVFNLAKHKPNKTIDIGQNGVSVSLDPRGRILQASVYHPEHGLVVAAPFEQFNGEHYYVPAYVRAYRTRMLRFIEEGRHGFGLDFVFRGNDVAVCSMAANTVALRHHSADHVDLCHTIIVTNKGQILQIVKLTNRTSRPVLLPYMLNLTLSLNRASYGQLTEGGPIPLPKSRNILSYENSRIISVQNPNLGVRLLSSLAIDGIPVDLSGLDGQDVLDKPIEAQFRSEVTLKPGTQTALCASFRVLNEASHGVTQLPAPSITSSLAARIGWISDHAPTTYIIRRNVEYILANCIVPTAENTVAVITDHVALPLGWNRDNYWQVRSLLQSYANLVRLIDPDPVIHARYTDHIHWVARGHLNWVLTQAKRPRGYWDRSYLVNGEPKDRCIFQLDQQCYPLLELCDHLDYFYDDIEFVKNHLKSGVVQQVLNVLEGKQNHSTGLWPTDETPGDDAVRYPYHFSSHVLLWRTFTRLGALFARIGATNDAKHSQQIAEKLHQRTMEAFTYKDTTTGEATFAYLTDGHGRHHHYHDANDVVTFFAREWGFLCSAADLRTWCNTMKFGLSSANKEAYCSELPYGGLGSVHSPGAWTLGYFQELAFAAWKEDENLMKAAWIKIMAAMQWDGTFPEAVDPKTGACTSKAWFSWPGSMIGVLLIQMRLNGQENILLGMA